MTSRRRRSSTDESTGSQGESPCSTLLAPCRGRARRRRIAWVAMSIFALAVLAASRARAQTTPAVPEDTGSQSGWAPAGGGGARTHTGGVPRRLDPQLTIAADPDTVFAALEDLRLTVERDDSDGAVTVTVKLKQDEDWLPDLAHDVTIRTGDTIAILTISREDFSSSVTRSGEITATLDEVDGYETASAKAVVHVISQEDPVVTFSMSRDSFSFAEDMGHARAQFVSRMAPDMPRGVTVAVLYGTSPRFASRPDLTATPGEDYEHMSGTVVMMAAKYELEDDRWVGRTDIIVPLFDDDIREGTEKLELVVARAPDITHTDNAQLQNPDGTPCGAQCRHAVHITDEEDIPTMELSVTPDEIMEEGETSSTATLAITDHKSFADDQAFTLDLGGTATKGDDYVLVPSDADDETPGYQVVLSVDSTSVAVRLKAMSDDVDEPDEKIEVSALLDGDEVGDMQDIEIMNQDVPKIAITADRDTIIAGMESLEFTVALDEPADEDLIVTVRMTQEQDWLSSTSEQLTFPAGSALHVLGFHESAFSPAVTESGMLTATVDPVSGYDTGDAAATVYVVSQEGPAMKVSFGHDGYRFEEDGEDPFTTLVAQAASGMPRGTSFRFSVSTRRGTATSPDDYETVSREVTVQEGDFTFVEGSWRARRRLPLSLVDDDVREGTEAFGLILEMAPGTPRELQLSDVVGDPCQDSCRTPVEITDDEDIPEFDLSVSEEEIMEDGETSSVATVSITNGKTFADDRIVTLRLRGEATPGQDYAVTPSDADEGAADHQVTLPAGSSSVNVTLTARVDDRKEGDEEIRLMAIHDGDEIGSESVIVIDRSLGPSVEIAFEGVEPPDDDYTAGIATGPFTTRFTFSEEVEGFTVEDIDWQTHSGTTEDSTSIGVHLWDFTEVREGVEYTVEMMATQAGRLWIVVFPGKARSVATGYGNQLGANSLWIRFPKDRMLVAPTEFTVEEGDAEGAFFLVVLTSEPTDTVKVTVSGTDGTEVEVDPEKLIVERKFWRVGRGMEITAGDDDNATSETVTLTVKAWGGGYEGRSEKVVVTVWDDDAAYVQGMSEDEALALADDVTPEAAAAALFGEELLSEDQLAALDRLGNRSGDYDLGDLLSWIARCRRGGASCGVASSSAPESIPAAAAAGLARGTSHRRRRGSGGRRAAARNRRVRRRRGASRYGSALLLAAAMTWWGCAGDVVRTPDPQSDPGVLAVHLTVPSEARDIGAMLVVEGPGMDSVRAPGFELLQSDASSSTGRQVIVSGALSTGTILEFLVPDRGEHARYRVRLLQVAGEGYTPRDVADYTAAISR